MHTNQDGSRGGNVTMSKAGLVTGVGTGQMNLPNNVLYTIDGVMNVLGNNWNQLFSSGHTALAAGCECLFGLWVLANNTTVTTQGKVVDTASLSAGTGTKVVEMPPLVSAAALIALIKVKTAGAATFTPGTTCLNATNVTATYYDTSQMPVAPLTS